MITSFDDTTTQINLEENEDQTQFLSGKERLRYFTSAPTPVMKPLSERKKTWFNLIRKWWE